MNESLRQALVEFLNLQGEAVYPAAGILLSSTYDGLELSFRNVPNESWVDHYPHPQDLAQFLLEYTIV